MNATVIDMMKKKSEEGAKVRQSFVTPFGNDPERWWESESHTAAVAETAFRQVLQSLVIEYGKNHWRGVLQSWGCVTGDGGVTSTLLRWRDMPALGLHVCGFEHTGWVVISLNEGADVYEVELADEQFFAIEGSRHDEVYCDALGGLIDVLVERGSGTQEEYEAKIKQAHPWECWAKEHGVEVVYL